MRFLHITGHYLHRVQCICYFSDVLSNFLENLGNINNVKTLIFILEDFHAFCSHQSQTLLYYLFDNVQSKKVSTRTLEEHYSYTIFSQ